MQPVIDIQNISKKYQIASSERYTTLRDVITGSVKNIGKRAKSKKETFWALENINLTIAPGERVGIIGRNGAGKSTLLKIISRITPPTKGRAVILGRIGSLLEVGTGFHNELTGMENIYLNGSILGLKKAEITRQLDAIIDFSGVEKFINSPLKHYSNGMQLRLAFAVAAHLESEILLIDEVLAVGDLEFQKKCLGKMEEVSRSEGRTILFVSHNLNFVSGLCNKVLLLNQGHVESYGNATDIIREYVSSILTKNIITSEETTLAGNTIVRLTHVRTLSADKQPKQIFNINEAIGIEMHYEVLQDGNVLWLGHNIHNQEGLNIFDTHNVNTDYYKKISEKGKYTAIAWIPANLLNTGSYLVSTAIFNHLKQEIHLHERDAAFFEVNEVFEGTTSRGMSPGDFPGVVRPLLNWDINKI